MRFKYKPLFRAAKLLAITGLTTFISFSCQEGNESITPTEEGVVSFKGQSVRLPKDFPATALTYGPADYSKILTFAGPGARVGNSVHSLAELDDVITPIRRKYPNTESLDNAAKVQIKKDFVNASDSQIFEMVEVIDEYYDKVASLEAATVLSKKKGSKGARVAYFGYNVSAAEAALLVSHPRNVDGTRRATDLAFQYEVERFGNNSYQTKGDAFRHSLWSALVAKYGGHHYGDVWRAVNWAYDFTNAHESGSADGLDKSMDIHNNAVGIEYFRSVAWRHRVNWIDHDVHAPDDNQFKNHLEPLATNATQVFDPSQIPNSNSILVYIAN